MEKTVARWQLAGFVFTSALGTFLHFLFDLCGGSAIAALVSAVNESIWEHIKLVFYPMVCFAMIEYRFIGKEIEGFWGIKLCGIVLAMSLVPICYYTYTGALGISSDWINILIFFFSAAAAYWVESKLIMRNYQPRISSASAVAVICSVAAAFVVLTFLTPRLPIFRDPISGAYGYFGK